MRVVKQSKEAYHGVAVVLQARCLLTLGFGDNATVQYSPQCQFKFREEMQGSALI